MKKKPGNEPQFETAADEIAYLREENALAKKTISGKNRIIDEQAEAIRQKDKEIKKQARTIERQAKTIKKQAETIAALKKKDKESASAIRNLNAAVGRYEKSLKASVRDHARTQSALDVALKRLSIVDNAHTPTSKQMVPEKGGQNGKDKPAKQPGPPAGHRGTTDERPATHQVRAKFSACKKCGCKWIRIVRMSEEYITDVPKVTYRKIKVTSLVGDCVACNHRIEGEFELDDVREIEPSGDGDGTDASGGGRTAGPPGDDDTDSKAAVRGGEREVDAGNGLVQIMRDEAAPTAGAEGDGQDTGTGDSKAPVHSGNDADEPVHIDQTGLEGHVRVKGADDGEAGDVVEADDTDGEKMEIPEEGSLGFYLLYVILLQWRHRVTIRGIMDILSRLYGLGLSTATIWRALRRMANGMAPEHDLILKAILSSPYIHVDETTIYVGSVKMWVWVIATREMTYYFVDTRSTTRIKEILKDYRGILIVDGYHTYRLLPPEMVQRCTVHIERDLKKWALDEENMMPHRRIVRNLAKRVRALILEAKDLKKAGRGPEMYAAMCAKLDALLKYYDRYPEIKKYVGYVRNAGYRIFTFMNYDYVDSDNNLAERAMREVVKHRVMKSLLRTLEGAEIFAILLTIMMTYKKGDILELLKKYMARGRKPGKAKQDKTAGKTSNKTTDTQDNKPGKAKQDKTAGKTSNAQDKPPDDGYG